jgi:Arc/MetJ family transcription regulator
MFAFRAVSLALPRALREKKKRRREQESKRASENVKM